MLGGHAWRARGARAYNWGQGRSPQRGPGAEPQVENLASISGTTSASLPLRPQFVSPLRFDCRLIMHQIKVSNLENFHGNDTTVYVTCTLRDLNATGIHRRTDHVPEQITD